MVRGPGCFLLLTHRNPGPLIVQERISSPWRGLMSWILGGFRLDRTVWCRSIGPKAGDGGVRRWQVAGGVAQEMKANWQRGVLRMMKVTNYLAQVTGRSISTPWYHRTAG